MHNRLKDRAQLPTPLQPHLGKDGEILWSTCQCALSVWIYSKDTRVSPVVSSTQLDYTRCWKLRHFHWPLTSTFRRSSSEQLLYTLQISYVQSAHPERKLYKMSGSFNAFTEKVIYIYIYNNDKGQPGAGGSFSVNVLNEPEILLSLWASKMIQSGQISVRTKSVSAHSPYVRFVSMVLYVHRGKVAYWGRGQGGKGANGEKARPRAPTRKNEEAVDRRPKHQNA